MEETLLEFKEGNLNIERITQILESFIEFWNLIDSKHGNVNVFEDGTKEVLVDKTDILAIQCSINILKNLDKALNEIYLLDSAEYGPKTNLTTHLAAALALRDVKGIIEKYFDLVPKQNK